MKKDSDVPPKQIQHIGSSSVVNQASFPSVGTSGPSDLPLTGLGTPYAAFTAGSPQIAQVRTIYVPHITFLHLPANVDPVPPKRSFPAIMLLSICFET